jgi:hypothetical protein
MQTTTTSATLPPDIPAGAVWWCWLEQPIELAILPEDAAIGSHQGRCDDDIAYLRRVPYIAQQLDAIDSDMMRRELRSYGAWDVQELADDDENISRLLWIACCDIVEESRNPSGE